MKRSNNVILNTVTKFTTFIILSYSIHLFFAGHHNPGGGFIGGLVTAAALVLILITFNAETFRSKLPINYSVLAAVGVLIAVATGVGSFFFNEPFLSHSFGYITLPLLGKVELATAVLFDVGVAFAVIGTALTIILSISEDG